MKQLLLMKKIPILCLLLLSSVHLFAQRNGFPNYNFRLGLTAYPTFGFIKAESGKGNGTNLGFAYGLLGDFNFAENYSFSTGVIMTTINGKSTEIDPSPYVGAHSNSEYANYNLKQPSAIDLKYKMQYIEIPLTIKLKTNLINNRSWYGQFGLSNDFRISAKQDAKSGSVNLANDVNASDWTNFYRAGIVIGAGVAFDLDGKTSAITGLTLNNGFTNISSSKNNVKNHFVALNLGVFF